MRIAVIGAGAMGTTFAGLLHRAGHHIEVTARGAALERVLERGILVDGAFGEHHAVVEAAGTLSATPELAIVATKAMDGAAVVLQNRDALRGVPVVAVQNGLGGLEEILAAAPETTLIGGLSLFAASYRDAGHVTITAAAPSYLGMVGDSDAAPARAAARTLDAALPTSAVDNFAGARWTKLLVNQVNALPAITGTSVQAVVDHHGLRRLMVRSMQEAVRVGLASGIHFEELNGLDHDSLVALAEGPLARGEEVPLRLRHGMGETPNPGSTLQSIRRGRVSEIDYLNGAVVREGLAVGVAAPVNELMTELVHEIEAGAPHLKAAAILERAETIA